MYRKQKTSRSLVAALCILLSIIGFAAFTTACEDPRPLKSAKAESPAVKSNQLPAAASIEPIKAVEKYTAPETWKETLSIPGSNTKIVIDAKITLPDSDRFQVYKIAPGKVSQDDLNRLVQYFVKDKKVFKMPAQQKRLYQAELARIKENPPYPADDLDSPFTTKEECEQYIASLETRINEMKDPKEKEYITGGNIGSVDGADGEYLWAVLELGNDTYGNVSSNGNGIDSIYNTFQYIEGDTVRTASQTGNKDLGDLKITPESAFTTVEKIFSDLGIKDMALQSTEKAQLFPKYKAYGSNNAKYPSSKGYYMVFSKSYGGIDTKLMHSPFPETESSLHYIYAAPEWIEIYVDENNEVKMFHWRGYNKTAKLLSDNVSILPFTQIQEAARTAIIPAVQQTAKNNMSDNQSFLVDAIELKTGIVSTQKIYGSALAVPVWYIRYTIKSSTQTLAGSVSLNAIDGGPIFVNSGIKSEDMWKIADGIAAGTKLEQSYQ